VLFLRNFGFVYKTIFLLINSFYLKNPYSLSFSTAQYIEPFSFIDLSNHWRSVRYGFIKFLIDLKLIV